MFLYNNTSLAADIVVNNITKESHYVIPNSSLNGRAFTVHLPLPVGLKNPAEVIFVAEDGTRERLTGSDLEICEHWVDMTVDQLCTFIVNARPTNAATIGGISYGTLQEAVNGAASGATITLEQNCTENITVSGKSLTIDLNGHTYDSSLVSVGANCTKTVSGDQIIVTYTAPYVPSQPSGGSSSSSGGYLMSVTTSKNGKVTVSPGRADKGDTVTITVKPDDSYELRTLTVTDKNGDSVKVTYKSASKYTFTMPAGKVTIDVSFREIGPDLPFADVSSDAYYTDAVLWAVEHGITKAWCPGKCSLQ